MIDLETIDLHTYRESVVSSIDLLRSEGNVKSARRLECLLHALERQLKKREDLRPPACSFEAAR